MNPEKRDYTLDIAKGFGILLVIWGHTFKGVSILNVLRLGSFYHMPLFFFVSGVAYYYSRHKTHLWHKVKPLIISYFSFSILLYLYWIVVEYSSRPIHLMSFYTSLGITDARLQQAINMLLAFDFEGSFVYNVVMWFLPCVIGAQTLLILANRYLSSTLQHIVLLVVCPGIYLVLHGLYDFRLPWCFELSLIAVPYFHLGHIIYRHDTTRSGIHRWRWPLFIIGLGLLILLRYIGIRPMAYYNQIAPLWWQFYLLALCGISCIMGLSHILQHNRVLQYLGVNSLALMFLHEPIKRLVIKAFSVILHQDTSAIRENALYCLIIVITVVLVCIPLTMLINRKLRFLLGKV